MTIIDPVLVLCFVRNVDAALDFYTSQVGFGVVISEQPDTTQGRLPDSRKPPLRNS